MNVLVDMYFLSTLACWAGGLYISSVDFGCFSTKYGDCEALEEREDQFELRAFIICTHEHVDYESNIWSKPKIP